MMEQRMVQITRETGETRIVSTLTIDGSGVSEIATGVGFFDHMLTLFAKHGMFDLTVQAQGDLYVDDHHTVEDIGIVLGQAFKEALGDKKGIKRYGTSFVPMDEALLQVSLDISGRPFLVTDITLPVTLLGNFSTEMVEEFLRAFAFNAGITLHVRQISGKNTHHIIEGIFKALGRALDEATQIDPRIVGVMSTKGIL
jgi:imidazoleglycerol-phosphate dehydratase